jgi:hypothetical protein
MVKLNPNSEYRELEKLLANIVGDCDILAGDVLGPSDVTWQDVAGTLMTNMRVYAIRLERIREGSPGMIAFPSIRETMAKIAGS